MKITVAGFKGGVGKTVSAVHIAAALQRRGASVLLVDGDSNRSALQWASGGKLPFTVMDAEEVTPGVHRQYDHMVIDTAARPSEDDLKILAAGCDLLVLPSTPDALALRALNLTIEALRRIRAENFKVLLTIIPPRPNRDADEAREALKESKVPIFRSGIRRFSAFQKAALAGVLVHETADPRGELGWEDYVSAVREMTR